MSTDVRSTVGDLGLAREAGPDAGQVARLGHAASLGLGRTTTYRLIKEGRLRSIKVGRRRLVPADEIARFLRDETNTN